MTNLLLGLLAGGHLGAAAGFSLGLRTEFVPEGEDAQEDERDMAMNRMLFETLLCNQQGD